MTHRDHTPEKGAANGLATLDSSTLVPLSQLPGKSGTQDNLSAGTAPTATDDSNAGYAVGSTWINTTADQAYVCVDATNGAAVWKETTAGAAGGEVNTASNVGAGGVGVFKQKTGVNLEFRNINAGSSKISVTNDTGNNEIDVDVVEANIVHDNLSGFSTNRHIDHTAVSITAGVGLSGGGNISASRTLALNVNGLTTETVINRSADFLPFYDVSAAAHRKALVKNIVGAHTNYGFTQVTTKNATYTFATRFIYMGSTTTGIPTTALVIGGVDSTATMSIRIFDITNSLTIAEVTDVTVITPSIINLGTISNIPTGQAIFELQILKSAGPGPENVNIAAINMR